MKNILLGITGGIACSKIFEIISKLKKNNFNIKVIMTKNATNFLTPYSLQVLTGNKVYVSMFEEDDLDIEHIELAKSSEIILIVPATANIIGKVSNGIADDFLTTVIMASKSKIVFALAMNSNMYQNKIFKENMEKLETKGYFFIKPQHGLLACGDVGDGKLAQVDDIIDLLGFYMQKKDLSNKTILITNGGTKVKIDPIRSIINNSSGKMGYNLCLNARNRGANVIYINSSKYSVPGVEEIKVETTQQMYENIIKVYNNVDIVIKVAAVSDFKLKNTYNQKIKKQDTLQLELVKDIDILKFLGENKNKQILVGFSAETENIIQNSTKKIKEKNLDFIVANDVSQVNCGFESNYNEVTIIDKNFEIIKHIKNTKFEIANRILDIFL